MASRTRISCTSHFRRTVATGERHPLIITGDFSEASGSEAARLLIAGRIPVDAIFCANDMMAVGCCALLAEAGVRVGPQIGVAGFDDIPIAHYTAPALTTMNARIAELGAAAAEKLIRLISEPDAPPGQLPHDVEGLVSLLGLEAVDAEDDLRRGFVVSAE